jgi:uncharacterized phage-associated protein
MLTIALKRDKIKTIKYMPIIAKKQMSPEEVAEFFLAFANVRGDLITNLKLQKLVYYAQAWHLANAGKPLFREDFQAWIHGPVMPKLYHKYKKYGYKPITLNISLKEFEQKYDKNLLDFLNEVAKVYMQFSAYQMELMTHQEAPWIKARKEVASDKPSNNIISKALMKSFYGQRISR